MTAAMDFAEDSSPFAFATVNVVGLGYIGLPTACVLARAGVGVHGVDVSDAVLEAVNDGRAHIGEDGIDARLARVVQQGRLKAAHRPARADAFVIAVPTPCKGNGSGALHPDLSFVEAAARAVAPVLRPGNLVILESTSPVGTTRRVAEILAEERPDLALPDRDPEPDIDVAYCPERIIPGKMLEELVNNDRIIGGMTPQAAERAAALYGTFVRGACLLTDDKTAEMVKLTENSFRDVNIAFANELSMVCDRLGIDPWTVIDLANRHPRVSILQPGAGVGGHCIAVDPWFIVHSDPDNARLIRTAREVNDAKPRWVESKVCALADTQSEARIVCCGLSYKPDVDDFRHSPALEITLGLQALYGDRVVACEPFEAWMPAGVADLEMIRPGDICDGDIVVILVGHTAFRNAGLARHPHLVDATGLHREPLPAVKRSTQSSSGATAPETERPATARSGPPSSARPHAPGAGAARRDGR